MSKYLVFLIEAVLLLALPIILLMLGSQFLASRPIFMALGGIYCSWRLWRRGATLASLGIHTSRLDSALRSLVIPSLGLILTTYLFFKLLPLPLLQSFVGYDPLAVSSFTTRILAYIFLSAPLQEIIFRGYLTWRLQEVFVSPRVVRVLSVAIFTLAHLPFYSPLLLFVSLSMGVLYIYNYQKYHNLFAPIISHSLVGAILLVIRNAWFPYS